MSYNLPMKKFLKVFLVSFVILYALLLVFWLSAGQKSTNGCTQGQEIEEGCVNSFPYTYLILLPVSLPPALIIATVAATIKKSNKQK